MVVTAVLTARRLTPDFEVIVVDDGKDGTARILGELARIYPEVRVVHHETNRGYGGALRTGFASARKEFVFYTDGDAQYDPSELETLWPHMTPGVDWSTATRSAGPIRCIASSSAASTTTRSRRCSASASATSTATSGCCAGRSSTASGWRRTAASSAWR